MTPIPRYDLDQGTRDISACLRTDDDGEWTKAADHLAALKAANDRIEKLTDLLTCLTDESKCWFDHHGGCQEHGFLSLLPGEMCPVFEAQKIINASKETK